MGRLLGFINSTSFQGSPFSLWRPSGEGTRGFQFRGSYTGRGLDSARPAGSAGQAPGRCVKGPSGSSSPGRGSFVSAAARRVGESELPPPLTSGWPLRGTEGGAGLWLAQGWLIARPFLRGSRLSRPAREERPQRSGRGESQGLRTGAAVCDTSRSPAL